MSYTVHQAKTNFSRILREVEAGEEVIVTRGNKPVARITAIEKPTVTRRVPGGFEGLVQADDSAFAPLNDQELMEYGFGFVLGGDAETKTGHSG
ncbi:MAG TPA: type II toxin-antitoxin system prevent-host-death family antitoxin [Terracidiphilus sp.]|nr:type II toxin-antitoxin system prevent-host-death family antitoxin [Terracidiphilus sp.]